MPGPPPLNDDLKELIKLFQSHRVEFLVVGAHALAFYARPRFTEDLDLFLSKTLDNVARARKALQDFGVLISDEAATKLSNDPRSILVLGRKPNQVDLLNFLDGVEFDSAWRNRQEGLLGELKVDYISVEDYIATKRASGRPKDLDDLRLLTEQTGP